MAGIDHIVICCRNLADSSSHYEALGFNLTPEAKHPWGTMNRLVQFSDSFLELLSIEDESLIQSSTDRFFSFGEFNKGFLTDRTGGSMIVIQGEGILDIKRFQRLGLPTYDLFSFERIANQPDGSNSKVAFELAFTKNVELSGLGFFTCRNLYPENFWRPEYQKHPNLASQLTSVVIVSNDPSKSTDFLSSFCNCGPIYGSNNEISFQLDNCKLKIVSPRCFSNMFGIECHLSKVAQTASIGAIEISVNSLEGLSDRLEQCGVQYIKIGNKFIANGISGETSLVFTGNGQ